MPLSEMDPNLRETDTARRKRNHDEFTGEVVKPDRDMETNPSTPGTAGPSGSYLALRGPGDCIRSPSHDSSVASDTLSSSVAPNSPSRQTPKKAESPKKSIAVEQPMPYDASTRQATAASQPVAKRKRLTPQEKVDREKEAAKKKKEKEEQAALKAAERARLEEQKGLRIKERDEKRKKKEEEERVRAEKKLKKEEAQKHLQEEKAKKARCQTKLNNFFTLPSTPKKTAVEPVPQSGSPDKPNSESTTSRSALSAYDQLFKPFFLKDNTRWTRWTTQMDEATREARSRVLDEFLSGQQEPRTQAAYFDVVEILGLPHKPPKRGRLHHPVKHIMEIAHKEAQKSEGLDGGAARNALNRAREKLATVPMKVIAFSQDVRPPYYGTMTYKPFVLGRGNMYRLARKTTDRRMALDYDYDSEAEWQDEEGEDVDVDDDEEEQDDEDDMEGFLDDSEDAGLSRRAFVNMMEPESSGMCFEDGRGVGPNPMVYEHRMELIHVGLERGWGVDPWSAKYWEEPTKSGQSAEKGNKMAPPSAPANAYEALGRNAAAQMVKSELLNDVKKAILDHKTLSKVGIIDFIFHEFRDSVSRAQVKTTLEAIAEKTGTGRSKMWNLKPGHEIKL